MPINRKFSVAPMMDRGYFHKYQELTEQWRTN